MTIPLDRRIPDADVCVLPRILAYYAESQPDRIFAVFEDGEAWSYTRTRDESMSLAAAVSYTQLTLTTNSKMCRSRRSP